MAKVFFLIIAITTFVGSNADLSRSLDFLLTRCQQIESSTNLLKGQIQRKIQYLEELKEQGSALSNRECINTINTNIQKVMDVVNDRSREVSRLERVVEQTRDYVNGVKTNPRDYLYSTEIFIDKEQKLADDMILSYNLNNRFVPHASFSPSDFIDIQKCFKNNQ